MFDDLDDDDVTDLIPDTESEKQEAEKRREAEKRGRRMTISEVRRHPLSSLSFEMKRRRSRHVLNDYEYESLVCLL